MKDTVIEPRWIAVRIDETGFWNSDIKNNIKSIHAHYIYDEKSVTYICSSVANYFLHFVGFDLETVEDIGVEEDVHDRISEGYCCTDNDRYCTERFIESIPLGNDRKVFMEWKDMKEWAEDYGDQKVVDELREAWSENPLW